MTGKSRSHDLTGELLQELAPSADAAPAAPGAPAPTAAPPAEPAAGDQAQPVVEASLFLAPRDWRRPALARDGRSLAISAGPLRLRLGR